MILGLCHHANRALFILLPISLFELLPRLQLVMEHLPHENFQFHKKLGFPKPSHVSVYDPPMC
jgi:hypothetical protein